MDPFTHSSRGHETGQVILRDEAQSRTMIFIVTKFNKVASMLNTTQCI